MPSPGAHVPPIPPGSRRMVICVPDNVEWLSLVTGCLAQLTFGWYYNKNSGDWEAARDRAKQMYFEFQDQNGLCDMIDCDEVADCIESSENVQQAIRNWLDANYQFSPSDYPPNLPLPTAQREQDRAGVFNPTCDKDILWAQSFQLVEWMNETVTDGLEAIEAATNTFEVAGAVSQITGLDELSVDAAFSYGNLLQDFIAENYAAAFTTEYKNRLACDIFCAAQDDCEISLDDLFNLFKDRVEAYFGEAGTFGVLDDVIDYLLGQSIDDTIVADAAFFLLWGGVVLANWILGKLGQPAEIGTKTLNLLLRLAVNDANDDWILLCEDCPELWAVNFPVEMPFSTFTALTYSGATTTIDADSIDGHTDTGNTAVFLNFEIELDGDISKVEFDVEWAFNTPFQQFILSDEGGTIQSFNLNGTSPATFTAEFSRSGTHTYTVLAGVQGTEAAGRYLRVTGMRWSGFGDNPFA